MLWPTHAQAPKAVVAGEPVCGFFLDHGNDGYAPPAQTYTLQMKYVFQMQNSTGSLSPECQAALAPDAWKCIMAPHAAPYIRTPWFALQSRFDQWQLGCARARVRVRVRVCVCVRAVARACVFASVVGRRVCVGVHTFACVAGVQIVHRVVRGRIFSVHALLDAWRAAARVHFAGGLNSSWPHCSRARARLVTS
jgi:hypothetical protein